MRRILVDHARRRRAAKRPTLKQQVELRQQLAADSPDREQLLALDEALTRLVEMDCPSGPSGRTHIFRRIDRGGSVRGSGPRTVKRNWSSARAWLQAPLRRSQA
jgi:hypothetical protein